MAAKYPSAVPEYLLPYVDEEGGDRRYHDYPRQRHRAWVRDKLAQLRLPAVLVGFLTYVLGTLGSDVLNGQPITWESVKGTLLFTRLIELGRSNLPLAAGLSGVALLVLVILFLVAEWAHRDKQQEKLIDELRRNLMEWKRDEALRQQFVAIIKQRVGSSPAGAPDTAPFDDGLLPPPEHFVGRTHDLAIVIERLALGGITAISGLPGIGKTALAAEAMRQLREQGRFTDGLVVLLARDLTDTHALLRDALTRFDPRIPANAGMPRLAEDAMRLLAGKDVLVMMDNIEPTLAVQELIGPLLTAGATLLLTARQTLGVLPPNATCPLGLLPEEEARDLFAVSYRGVDRFTDLPLANQAPAAAIVDELGRHTLAIKLAGGYAATTGRDLAAVARELANPQRAIDLEVPGVPEQVKRAFDTSYLALDDEAQRLFVALATFDGADFGRDAALAVARGLSLDHAEQNLDLLISRRLADQDTYEAMPEANDRERLRLHPLMRAYAGQLFVRLPQETRDATLMALATFYADYATKAADSALGPEERNIEGVIAWLSSALPTRDFLMAKLISRMAPYWESEFHYPAAARWISASLGSFERLGDEWGELHAAVQLTLGRAQFKLEKPDLAQPILLSARTLAQRFGSQQLESLVLAELGDVALRFGLLAEAQDYFQQSRERGQAIGDRRLEGIALRKLGDVELRARPLQAREYFEQSLTYLRQVGDILNAGHSARAIGDVCVRIGDLLGGRTYYQQALDLARQAQDKEGEGFALRALGDVALLQGDIDSAEQSFAQSLATWKEISNLAEQGNSLRALGQAQLAQDNLASAQDYFLQALELAQHSSDRGSEAQIMRLLGDTAYRGGDHATARRHYQQSYQIAHEIDDRLQEAEAIAGMGFAAPNTSEAMRLWRDAVRVFRSHEAINRRLADTLAALGETLLESHDGTLRLEGCRSLAEAVAAYQAIGLTGGQTEHVEQLARNAGCQRQTDAIADGR